MWSWGSFGRLHFRLRVKCSGGSRQNVPSICMVHFWPAGPFLPWCAPSLPFLTSNTTICTSLHCWKLYKHGSAQWSNTVRNVSDFRNMTCFRTIILALCPFTKWPRLLKTSYLLCNVTLYVVYTSPLSDVRKSSAVPDVPVEH